MTLDEWRIDQGLQWMQVAKQLSSQGCGPIYDNRLNRLRAGRRATIDEMTALFKMTDGDVEDFKDEKPPADKGN